MKLSIKTLYDNYKMSLSLNLVTGIEGLNKSIKKVSIHRPGLILAGYYPKKRKETLLVFGHTEIDYLHHLDKEICLNRLKTLLIDKVRAVIVTRKKIPIKMTQICQQKKIALFYSSKTTLSLVNSLFHILTKELSSISTIHATFVDVFGIGILMRGESSIGKSETALGLLKKGHRLIADDLVKIKKVDNQFLLGFGHNLTKHLLEIRGIGILDIAQLFGASAIREKKKIDVVVQLEKWQEDQHYDRVGLKDEYCDVLEVNIPYYILPVTPGRDIVHLIEVICLHQRLKNMGRHSAKEFHKKLLGAIASKTKKTCENNKKSNLEKQLGITYSPSSDDCKNAQK